MYIKLYKNFFVKEKSQIKSDFKDTWLQRHNPQPRKYRRKEWIGEKERTSLLLPNWLCFIA